MHDEEGNSASRRALLAGAAGVGLAGALAACGGDETPEANPGSTNNAQKTTAPPVPRDTALAKTSEIPVGSGKIFFADAVVVTQPTAGEFVGLSAICTHEGCIVSKISGNTIICGCHGSEYSITGGVKRGPANRGLDKQAIKVEGDEIKLG